MTSLPFYPNFAFSNPWALLLLFMPLLYWLGKKRWGQKAPALVFSHIKLVAGQRARGNQASWRLSTLWLPSLFFILGWCALVIALSGPRLGDEKSNITTQGLAIGLVVDASGSMMDPKNNMLYGEEVLSRLEAVRRVITRFVEGDKDADLKGRKNDLLSLISFNTFVDDQLCPLTLDHDFLTEVLANSVDTTLQEFSYYMQAPRNRSKLDPFGTALYDAVAKAAEQLHRSGENKKEAAYEVKSRILIVLSDGEDTASVSTLEECINIAKEFGVRVYTIAVYNPQSIQQDIFGFVMQGAQKGYNTEPLKQIARDTQAQFYEATDIKSLEHVYADIDSLEKSEIHQQFFMDYAPFHQPWLLAGLIFLSVGLLLKHSVYRELP